jgi:hypothetical protein
VEVLVAVVHLDAGVMGRAMPGHVHSVHSITHVMNDMEATG